MTNLIKPKLLNNMREIKFRVWITDWGNSTSHLEYIKEGCLHVYFGNWERGGYKNAIFQQFTGLKDKNGKEIYEGDIVELTLAGKTLGIIKFEHFGFNLVSESGSAAVPLVELSEIYEIKSNIFENTDLLK